MQYAGFLGKLLLSGRKEQTGPMFERSIFHDSVQYFQMCLKIALSLAKKHLAVFLAYFCHVKNRS